MQKYSVLNNLKEKNIIKVYIIIFVISLIATYLINLFIVDLQTGVTAIFPLIGKCIELANLLNLIPSASLICVFYLLKLLFDRWLWRFFVCFTGIPNINGEWHGVLSSSFGENTPMEMIIKQTLNQIKITCNFGESKSESYITALDVKDFCDNGNWTIYFSYNNQNVQTDEHIGFNIVKYKLNSVNNCHYLDGEYFTNRKRLNSNDKGTFGTFRLYNT